MLMTVLINILLGLVLVAGRWLLLGWFGLIADALWVSGVLYFNRQTGSQRALYLLLVGSLVIDLVSSKTFPLYTATTGIAWFIYSEFIGAHLSFLGSWNRWLCLTVWLILWRVVRVILVLWLWFSGLDGAAPTNLDWLTWLIWLAGGTLVWLVVEWLIRIKQLPYYLER
ncbi:MAG: hypothetical protein WC621_01120 [Patescibacteria group bacterium]